MRRLLPLLTIFFFIACSPDFSVKKIGDGIVVELPKSASAAWVRLQVYNARTVRVTAGPTANFPKDTSLVVVSTPAADTKWTLEQGDSTVALITTRLRVTVNGRTGAVSFADSAGTPFLVEKSGGRTFEPIQDEGQAAYTIRQVFESADDEAFYGLGQHQEGVMNHKGKDLPLFQYNTKVTVPFLVSNKGYGILWDNYSLSKFGDPREYRQLTDLNLFDKNGQPGGLSGRYGSRTDTGKVYLARTDSVIDYAFLPDLKKFPAGFPLPDGKVTWEGSIGSETSGQHKFLLYYAGYTRVWIDGKQIADHWRQAWNPGTIRAYLDLEAGKKYPIRIEWIPDGGESYLSLKWQNAHEDQNRLSLWSEIADAVDYYVVAGKDMDEVIAGYRTLTGKAPMMPKWAMGFWQSRERYKSQAELLEVVRQFRSRNLPLDNIVQDWFYWKENEWGSQQFDPERFPDPEGMIREVHDTWHAQFMISVWPKFYEGIPNYETFRKNGWLYPLNVQNRQKDWVGPGYVSTFFDAYNPSARTAFWELLRENLYSKGVDAWWLDASEPDILSNASVDERKKLMHPTALGSGARYFNAYPLVNEMAFYNGQRQADPNKRVFILTRSAFAGSQRYAAATWSGDIGAIWKDFETQIPAGLNFSLSGIPYWTTDIGGFSVENRFVNAQGETLEEWREQMTRWFQFGAFSPLFRAHGQFPFREIYHVAPESHPAYQTMAYYDRLRYRLMPYLYSLVGWVHLYDYTPMRALVMDFPNDRATWDLGNQFLLGPNLLVAPVMTWKARTRSVYLPAGTDWYDFHSGAVYEGGKTHTVAAPYTQIPVFVKAGAILPAGPELQYALEKPADPVTLYVFTGKNGEFTLYEDENINNNYEQGKYATIRFSYDEASRTLTLHAQEGEFAGMLRQRTFEIVWVSREKPVGVGLKARPDVVVTYDGTQQQIMRK
jgi:alpha-D-xyloside xylohydrolase